MLNAVRKCNARGGPEVASTAVLDTASTVVTIVATAHRADDDARFQAGRRPTCRLRHVQVGGEPLCLTSI
jgi:hypothetical protein